MYVKKEAVTFPSTGYNFTHVHVLDSLQLERIKTRKRKKANETLACLDGVCKDIVRNAHSFGSSTQECS